MATKKRTTRRRKAGAPRRASSSPVRRGRREGAGALSPQEQALRDVSLAIDALEQPAAIIGGIAVISHGFSRLTSDIDCAVGAPREAASAILGVFEKHGFSARTDEPIAFAVENLVLLLRHDETEIGVDVSLAQLEFEAEALARAETRSFGAVTIRVPQLTDLLIYKALAGRPRDQQDLVELLALGAAIDVDRIEKTLSWFDELMDTDRLGDWQRLRRELP